MPIEPGPLTLIVVLFVLLSGCTQWDHWQLRQDVQFIKTAIAENYPYLPVHQRRDGFDWLAAVDLRLQNEGVPYNPQRRMEYLSHFLRGLNGHVHLVSKDDFAAYRSAYSQIAQTDAAYAPWAEVLNRPAVLQAYGASSTPPSKTAATPPAMGGPYGFVHEVRGSILYLKVPTFEFAVAATEGPRIVAFLREHSSTGTTVVFDVRGNGGGSDSFWSQYLVRPLLTSTLQQESRVLYRGGALSQAFLKAKVPVLEESDKDPYYRYSSVETNRIEPLPHPIPHGPIVVLMDGRNFSSSETFVSFCKATGFAKTVGFRSGGDGIGFDPIVVELPYSHLILTIPICAALTPEGVLDYEFGTRPDVVLDAQTDAMDWVLGQYGPLK